ncbi:MAG: CoA:oxalate CoA-transferase [Candidatus Azotimanducaceae bacterium]|jgi:CoA:oxalate CoA-transferase|tara:strand:+ start:3321 stop:4532 length:1212 start_codon:yes stop_codon:yes gene_type:complete
MVVQRIEGENMSEQQYPLEGLKVLDFSRVLAGPFAGRMLCDLGADVVKVEPPDGDVTRLWGKVIQGLPGYYHQQNAGKRNICMDLRADGAKELVFQLVKEADILIENYRPDVMPRLGLGYEDLKAVNPKLIMLSISGFGHGGPESHRPAYAPIVHAEAGLMYRQADRGGLPFNDLPLSVADTNASLHGLVGLLAAVILRQRTGLGQHIDIAMIDATVATDDQVHYAIEDAEGTAALPNDTWETGAGPILLSADFRFLWQQLTRLMGVNDPTYKEMQLAEKIRVRREIVGEYLAGLPTWADVEEAMGKMNLAWGQVRDPADLQQQPTVAARGAIVQIDDRAGGTRPITQSPYRFSAAKSGVRGPAPHRGEHNIEVLAHWLKKTSSEVSDLQAKGVLKVDEEFVK